MMRVLVNLDQTTIDGRASAFGDRLCVDGRTRIGSGMNDLAPVSST